MLITNLIKTLYGVYMYMQYALVRRDTVLPDGQTTLIFISITSFY